MSKDSNWEALAGLSGGFTALSFAFLRRIPRDVALDFSNDARARYTTTQCRPLGESQALRVAERRAMADWLSILRTPQFLAISTGAARLSVR